MLNGNLLTVDALGFGLEFRLLVSALVKSTLGITSGLCWSIPFLNPSLHIGQSTEALDIPILYSTGFFVNKYSSKGGPFQESLGEGSIIRGMGETSTHTTSKRKVKCLTINVADGGAIRRTRPSSIMKDCFKTPQHSPLSFITLLPYY